MVSFPIASSSYSISFSILNFCSGNFWFNFSFLCRSLIAKWRKHHKFSILWVVQACKTAFLLNKKLGTTQTTWPWAFNFAWSWYIYYWVKSSHLLRSCKSLHPSHMLVFTVFGSEISFTDKLTSIPLAFLSVCQQSNIIGKSQLYPRKYMGIIALVELEKHVTDTCIFSIVI